MSDRVESSPHEITTLVEVLRLRSAETPDRTAYTFLIDGETTEATLTYQEIDDRARAIGAHLQSLVAPGERALLMFPPGLDYIAAFFGCLYARVIAVPTYLPNLTRPNQTFARLQAIIRDARPTVALIPATLRSAIDRLDAQESAFHALRWIETDTIARATAGAWRPPELDSTTLAFLQYTSGSTAAPKGVMLTHGNLLHNLGVIHNAFAHTSTSRGVIWLPPYHDMGLIGGILQPLYGGFPVTLMSPVHFLQRPIRWLEAISRTKATTSGGPNFAYDLCTRKITPEQRAALDLSSWTVAFTGAEPIRAETLTRFETTFGPCGFRREAWHPCYGLAEATLMVSGSAASAPPVIRTFASAALEYHQVVEVPEARGDSRTLAGCGQPLGDQQLVIADPVDLTQCGPGQVGEVWIAGPSVAQGYWDRPDETRQTFRAYLADSDAGPFLRTGDLGFVQDGEVFITGRLKDVIIIRGRNHYPQDIELTVEQSHAALRPGCGAAFSVEVADEERLVVVQEIERQERQPDVAAIAGAIRQAVIEQHELQVYAVVLLKPARIPKTSSGKIQRQQCRQAFLAGTLDALASSVLDEAQALDAETALTRAALLAVEPEARYEMLAAYLRRSTAEVLRQAPALVADTTPINSLGFDSVMAIELKHRFEVDLGIDLPLTAFLKDQRIADLATAILDQVAAGRHASALPLIADRQPTDHYPLSSAQAQFWFLEQITPGNPAHVIAAAADLSGQLDAAALEQSLDEIVRRHEALRTIFMLIDGVPHQRILPTLHIPLSSDDLRATPEAERMIEVERRLQQVARQAFDLARGPLIRATLLQLDVHSHVLLLVVHHSVADGWSMGVIFRELLALYNAFSQQLPSPLPDLTVQYVDFAAWQRQWLQSEAASAELAYWKQQLQPENTPLPVLELPTDRPRPAVQTFQGARHRFTVPDRLRQALEALGQREGVTLFTTLLAAFQVLLARYTGQTDIVVGSPIAQRNHAELERLVGSFANVLVFRGDLSGNPSVRTVLRRLWSVVLGAYEHHTLPFERLVEVLQPQRDPSRHPLFQVAFVLQNMPLPDEQPRGLALQILDIDRAAAQFDLKLDLIPRQNELVGLLEYNTDLFEAATIARLAGHFQALLERMVTNPDVPIAELPLLTEAEQQQMLVDWNRSEAEYPRAAAVHALIEAQAARTPNASAIVFAGQALTYAELNARANQLAHHLRGQGVGPDVLVALCVERSLEMIVGILAILKAGGAYLPLDPTYPAERLHYMLSHSRAPVLLTQAVLVERLPEHQAQVFCLDADWHTLAQQPTTNPPRTVLPEHLAYIIFTSGSTGRPKGVMVTQRGLVNLVYGLRAYFADPAVQTTGLITSISFDISVNQIFPTLFFGRTLHIIPDAVKFDSRALLRYLHEQQVHLLDAVPSYMHAVLNEVAPQQPPNALRYLLIGGEKIEQRLLQSVFGQLGPQVQVVNIYGLTEISDINILGVLRADDLGKPVTVGTPLQNNR
ncbi:MAG TPA: AMP-binding protein, partial [Herpetosiphonaceae bacterium]